jgi:ATP-binding cassette subfamily F protein 3
MRQALSVALIEYSGALVVISHDRHLLRSVCDELLIVHDGIVDRFTRSLDEYPAWLREQEALSAETEQKAGDTAAPVKQLSKKQLRQQQAQRRERLKPLYDIVRKAENELESRKKELDAAEQGLADQSIYADSDRQSELAELVRTQSHLKAEIEALESKWMDASETLERAE